MYENQKHHQSGAYKYNQLAVRVAKEHLAREPIRSWSFPFKYVPDDPNNFVNIPEPVPI